MVIKFLYLVSYKFSKIIIIIIVKTVFYIAPKIIIKRFLAGNDVIRLQNMEYNGQSSAVKTEC